jgi:anti-sigma B factor antagonist
VTGTLINTVRGADGTVVVDVRGEIDLGSADRLRAIITDAATRLRPPRLIIDLLHVTFIDSVGIGSLAAGRNAARAAGIGFTLRHPSAFVTAQLRQTGLYDELVTDR